MAVKRRIKRNKPRLRPKSKKGSKRALQKSFLAVDFGVSKAGHPELYDFLLSDCKTVIEKLGDHRATVTLERLEPLNLVYSNLAVSPKVLDKIFKRFCKSHKLKPFSSGYNPKHRTSCHGGIATQNLPSVMQDYNLLFDVFFCDIRLQTKHVMIDVMDPFSNSMIVQGLPGVLKKFAAAVKKVLPKTSFKTV